MADSACYIELASNNGDFFTNSLTDDIMIRPQYATQKILIGTSNGQVPSLTITSNSVGIGTTNPATKLDVSGTINATTYTGATITELSNLGIFGSNTTVWSSNNLLNKAGGSISGTLAVGTTSSPSAGSVVDVNGTLAVSNKTGWDACRILVASAGHYLHIGSMQGAGHGKIAFNYTRREGAGLVSPEGGFYGKDVAAYGRSAIKFNVDGSMDFLTEASNVTLNSNNFPATRMTINSNGDVGIGTISPTTTLDVNGHTKLGHTASFHGSASYRNIVLTALSNSDNQCEISFEPNAGVAGSNTVRGYIFNRADGFIIGTGIGGNTFFVGSNNNVGIGTTSPAYKLDVSGTTRIQGNTAIYGGNAAGGGAILSLRNTATANEPRWIFRGPDWGNNAGLYIGYNECNDTSFNSGINGGNSAMSIRAVGSYYTVGIGTSANGSFALQVNGTYCQYGQIASFVYSNVTTLIGGGDTATRYNGLVKQGDSFIVGYSNALNTGGLVLGTWSGGMSGIRVDGPTGNVGVGSSNPAYKLDVAGDIITTWIRSRNNAGWYNETYGGGFYMTDTTWVRTYGTKNFFHDGSIMRTDGQFHIGNGGTTFLCSNGGDFAYRTNVLYANTAGNVGIGTASPAYKLDVAGTINATSYSNVSYFYLKDQPSQIWRSDFVGGGVNWTGYFKIATLPDINAGANGTGVNIRGWGGGFGLKMKFDCMVSTRGGVNMKAYTSGAYYDNSTDIMLYQESDNTFSLYFWNNNYFTTWWFEVCANTQYGGTLLTPSGTRTTPTGTLITAMSSNLVTVASGTNFGVGTSNPSANIHINNDLHIAANSGSWNSSAGKGIYMRYSTNGGQDAAYLQSITRSTTTYQNLVVQASNIQLSSGSDIGTSSPPFFMKYDGNIGIGTNTPSYKLDVSGGTRINNPVGQSSNAIMTLENSTSTNKIGMFVNLQSGNYNGCVSAGDSAIIGGTGSVDTGSLVLGVWGNSNGGMKIDKTGFIGIGTSTPAYKLDVSGSNIRLKATSSTSNDLMEIRLASAANSAEQRKGFTSRIGFYGRAEYDGSEVLDASIDVVFGSNLHYPVYPGMSSTQMTFSTKDFGGGRYERMRITATGDVGIGTSNPSQKLDVNGNINANALTVSSNVNVGKDILSTNTTTTYNTGSYLYNQVFNLAYSNVTQNVDGSKYATAGSTSIRAQTLQWGSGAINVYGAEIFLEGGKSPNAALTPGSMLFKTNNAERMRIDENGNLGIGTSSPSYKLDVSGNMKALSSSTTTGVIVGTSDVATIIGNTAGAANYGSIQVRSGGSSSSVGSSTYKLYLQPDGGDILTGSGNVGIGTTSPLSKLDVNGDTVIRGRAIIGNSNYTLNTQGTLNIYNPGILDTGGARVWITASNQTHMTIGKHATNNNGDGYIWLPGAHGLSIGTNDTERIKILSSGNVGIGISTPSSTLHVSGNSILNGGNQIAIQNNQDGGTGRGIYMWNLNDTAWGIYMGQSGASKSLSGGTACAGHGFSGHAVRIRVTNQTTQGFILENSAENLLMSVRGDGLTYIAGNTTAYNVSIGNAGHGGAFAAFAHSNYFNTSSYCLLHQDIGETFLNCASGRNIRFREQNNDIAIISGSKMGILTTSPSYQLHVVGTIYATGDIIGFSDIRLKSNITIIDSALSKIHKLNGYTFNIQDDEKAHTGLIAQEVLEVLPEAVHQEKKADGTDGYYSLAYGNMAGLFVEAIKEIDNKYKAQITELKETISILKQEIDLLKNK